MQKVADKLVQTRSQTGYLDQLANISDNKSGDGSGKANGRTDNEIPPPPPKSLVERRDLRWATVMKKMMFAVNSIFIVLVLL